MKILVNIIMFIIIASSGFAQDSVMFAVVGDYGTADINEQRVAELIHSWNPQFVITLGDNSYDNRPIDSNIGQFYSRYIGDYTGTFGTGADTNRFFPCPGNHDWTDGAGITAYLNYFNLPGNFITTSNTSGNERYYDFIRGPIHFFVLSSYSWEYDGNTATSIQAQWLENQMTASTAKWKIVYMHHPPYSSSTKSGSQVYMQWNYEGWGADVVLGGHDHTYERLMRDDNSDGKDIPYIVNGTGGRPLYGFPLAGFVQGSVYRYNSNFGAMKVIATDETMKLYYYSIDSVNAIKDSLVLTKIPTSVVDEENNIPNGFMVSQNYPNPFNPSTTIEFAVPYKMQLSIEIFNILGEKVKLLYSDEFTSGNYSLVWDGKDNAGNNVSSGVYLYKISSDNFSISKKMLLLK